MNRPTKQQLVDHINRNGTVVLASPDDHSLRSLELMAHSGHLTDLGCDDPAHCIVCKPDPSLLTKEHHGRTD